MIKRSRAPINKWSSWSARKVVNGKLSWADRSGYTIDTSILHLLQRQILFWGSQKCNFVRNAASKALSCILTWLERLDGDWRGVVPDPLPHLMMITMMMIITIMMTITLTSPNWPCPSFLMNLRLFLSISHWSLVLWLRSAVTGFSILKYNKK